MCLKFDLEFIYSVSQATPISYPLECETPPRHTDKFKCEPRTQLMFIFQYYPSKTQTYPFSAV